MSLTDFIGVLSHRFRKVGAVCVSETYYDDPSTHVASVLLTHGQLIAIAQQYGLLVVAAPGQSATGAQGVYVAQAGSVLSAIEADRAAAEEEAADRGQEKSGRQQDLPRQDNLFKFVDVQEVRRNTCEAERETCDSVHAGWLVSGSFCAERSFFCLFSAPLSSAPLPSHRRARSGIWPSTRPVTSWSPARQLTSSCSRRRVSRRARVIR